MSGGTAGPQLELEVRSLPSEDREKLLHSAGIKFKVPAGQGLAMRCDTGLPWNQLRELNMDHYQVTKGVGGQHGRGREAKEGTQGNGRGQGTRRSSGFHLSGTTAQGRGSLCISPRTLRVS